MLEVLGTIFIITFGVLGHFIYAWSNRNYLVGYFAAVNESVWEHIKLVIGPTFLWGLFEIHFYLGNDNLWFAKFISLLVMCFLIPILFYSYTKITKRAILIVDIVSYILTIIIGEIIFNYMINMESNIITFHIGIIGLIIIFIKYMTSTYTPGKSDLYKSPTNNKYGIDGFSRHRR